MMDYEIISTGSKGNCAILEKTIAVDMGVPFKRIQPYYKDFELVLLTHIHG